MRTVLLMSLALILLVGFTTALYYSVTSRIPFGTDSYVFWLAAHEVVRESGNPYSEAVTTEAQLGVYGRMARPGENYMMFVNPPYSLLPFLPTAWVSYSWAQAYWIAVSILSLIVVVWAVYPRTPLGVVATLPFVYPAARGIIMGQFSPSIACALLIAYALSVDHPNRSSRVLFLAGLALSWTTVKPQLTWMFHLFFLLVGIRTRRWPLFWGFGFGMVGLLTAAWIMVPGWPAAWLQQAVAHADNRVVQPGVLLWASWVSSNLWVRWLGWLIMVLAIVWTVYLFVRWWRKGGDLFPVFGAIALLSLVVHPLYFPPAQIVLLLPILAWAGREEVRNTLQLKISWLAALILPWLIFALTFRGAEPYAISIWTPVLFLVWFLWVARSSEGAAASSPATVRAGMVITE